MNSSTIRRGFVSCVLLSGGEDLRVGVQQAHEYGIRVHLLGIRPSRGSQSSFLREEADRVDVWGGICLPCVQSAPASLRGRHRTSRTANDLASAA